MSGLVDTSPPTTYVEGLCHAVGLDRGMDRRWRRVDVNLVPPEKLIYVVICPCLETRAIYKILVHLERVEIGPPIVTYWVGQCRSCKTIYWGSR